MTMSTEMLEECIRAKAENSVKACEKKTKERSENMASASASVFGDKCANSSEEATTAREHGEIYHELEQALDLLRKDKGRNRERTVASDERAPNVYETLAESSMSEARGFKVGDYVQLQGLQSRPEFNGRKGHLADNSAQHERWQIFLMAPRN
jgi:hypothetical protein